MNEILLPDGWPRPRGYANGTVASGRMIFISGQIGWDPVTEVIEHRDFTGQVRRALENAIAVLRSGGASPSDVVRTTWFVTDLNLYRESRRELGAVWRDLFGAHYPAMSVIGVAELLDGGALVEIEVTAVVGD